MPRPGEPENRPSAGENRYNRPAVAVAEKSAERAPNAYSGGEHRSPTTIARENDVYRRLLSTAEGEEATVSAPLETTSQERPAVRAPLFPERPASQSPVPPSLLDKSSPQSLGRVLAIWQASYAIVERGDGLAILSLPAAERCLRRAQLMPPAEGLKPQPLLIPLALTLSDKDRLGLTRHAALLQRFGIQLSVERQKVQATGCAAAVKAAESPTAAAFAAGLFKRR